MALVLALATACTLPFDPALLDAATQRDAAPGDASRDAGERIDASIDGGAECGVTLVAGWTADPPPAAGLRPGQGVRTTDPARGACLTRVSDSASEPLDPVAGSPLRLSPNADGTRVLVSVGDQWHVYDTQAYRHVVRLRDQGRAHDVVWDDEDPALLYATRTDGTSFAISRVNAENGFSMPGHDLRDEVIAVAPSAVGVTTTGEGTHVSADGRYWVLHARAASGPGHLITYDADTETVLAHHDLAAAGDSTPTFLMIGANGEHVVMGACGGSPRVVAFDRTFTTRFDVVTSCVREDQITMALTPDGNEAVVYVAEGAIEAVDLSTRASFRLVSGLWFPPDGGIVAATVSGRAPGWIVASFYDCTTDGMSTACAPSSALTQDEIALVEVAPAPAVYELAWHQSEGRPGAVPSADLTRVLFTSDWGGGELDVYELRIPAGAVPP